MQAPAIAKASAPSPASGEPRKAAPRSQEKRPTETAMMKAPATPEPSRAAKPDSERAVKPEPPQAVKPPPPAPERKTAAAPAKPSAPEPERKTAATPPPPPATAPKPASDPPPERKPAAPEVKSAEASAPPQESGGSFWRDQGLTFRVQSKLSFSRSLWRSSGGILVTARNGVVTLTGTVPVQEDIAEAGRIAAAVEGVREVRNELRVGPSQ
jgi:hypothetical protein